MGTGDLNRRIIFKAWLRAQAVPHPGLTSRFFAGRLREPAPAGLGPKRRAVRPGLLSYAAIARLRRYVRLAF